ncbi:MAG TPA: hypothetical protein VHK27_10490 [Gammaproteobacteria bacterium]|nr:hypothetical protein [Gammaproteobacteria bacterium]
MADNPADNPWSGITNLGAIDQKLYQPPTKEPAQPSPAPPQPENLKTGKPETPLSGKPENRKEGNQGFMNTRKPENLNTGKPDFVKAEKYSTQLQPELIKQVKQYALEHDLKDYEVVQIALREYLKKK